MTDLVKQDIDSIIYGVGVPLMDLEGKNVLITGACGFLGSWFTAVIQHLNKYTFATPCSVTAIDSFIATDKQNHIVEITDPNIRFIKKDVSQIDNFQLGYHYIIHAAGIASPIYYRKYPIETIEGMVMGLHKLLEYSVLNPIQGMLVFSSSEMYGNPYPDKVPTPESFYGNVSCTGPRSCYDESKRMEEALCVAYHRIHNTPVRWVRPFNVYGPGMRVKDDRVVPKFMFQALRDEPITVHLPGVQTRTFCYITDAMIGFFKALLIGNSGEVWNIGNGENEMSMEDLAVKIDNLFLIARGKGITINRVEMPTEYPQDQAQRRCPDLTKAREELLYHPKISIDAGLERMLIWCGEQI